MGTHATREHPTVDDIARMTTTQLWRYTLTEVEFLTTPDQRRIPQPVEAAIRELHKRRNGKA